MGKEYDLKLIKDYVEGNDIENYNVDELENDYRFMISVIKYTNDKNMYDLCSDGVKNNYEFVKFIINYFKDDMLFIDMIAEKYLNNSDNKKIFKDEETALNYIDIILNMIDLNKGNIEHYNKYSLLSILFYTRYMMPIELGIKEEKAENEFGKGFFVLEEDFKGNEKVLDFFATNLIHNILHDDEDFNLEIELHKEYDSFSEIEEQGINNFMINLLGCYDKYLAGYVSGHLNTLTNFKNDLLKIKNSWSDFLYKNEQNRYGLILEKVHSYIMYSEPAYCLEELEVLCYIGTELGIEKQIIKATNLSEDEYQDFMFTKDFYLKSMNPTEQKHYQNIKNIMIDVLSQKIVDDKVDNYTSNDHKQARILRFDSAKHKVNTGC